MTLESRKFPKTIYKYRSWDDKNHKKLLIKNELYIPTPKDLNDPFDCKINYDYSLLRDEKRRVDFVNHMIDKHGHILKSKGHDLEELRTELNSRFLNNLIEEQKLSDEIRDTKRDIHQGVVSFSKIWDNMLMWSHYSDNHKGFCVGFKTKKFIESEYFMTGSDVHYNDEYPKINPMNDDSIDTVFKMLYNKTSDWSYEQEYRMTKIFGFHRDETEFKKQKLFLFSNDYISEVILGLKISDDYKKEIIEICKSKNISVLQIEQVPYKFELIKTKLF